MKLSETYVTNRAVAIVNSMTEPKQSTMAQNYCHLLIDKIDDSITKIQLIYKVRDMIIIKVKSLAHLKGWKV